MILGMPKTTRGAATDSMRIGRYALWMALATTGCGALATAGAPDDAGLATDATDAAMLPSGDAAALRDGQPVSDADSSLPPDSPDLSGRWALFGFEDPVAVDIRQSGTTLTGMGCSAGFPRPGGPSFAEYCGSLFASVFDGTRAQFNYRFESYWYGADVTVSAKGDRMTGLFHGTSAWLGPMAWLRIAPDASWLDSNAVDASLREASTDRVGSYDLSLTAGPTGDEYASDRVYLLNLSHRGVVPVVTGEFGAFWATEMVWNPA